MDYSCLILHQVILPEGTELGSLGGDLQALNYQSLLDTPGSSGTGTGPQVGVKW